MVLGDIRRHTKHTVCNCPPPNLPIYRPNQDLVPLLRRGMNRECRCNGKTVRHCVLDVGFRNPQLVVLGPISTPDLAFDYPRRQQETAMLG